VQHTTTQCSTLQHTAAHCSTLQHTAAHRNTLQITAPHSSTLQHTAAHCKTMQHTAARRNTPQHTATRCHTLQHSGKHSNTPQPTAAHCNILQHTTTHRNTLQHTATHFAHHLSDRGPFRGYRHSASSMPTQHAPLLLPPKSMQREGNLWIGECSLLRWGWAFLEPTQILSGIQFFTYVIEFVVVVTKQLVGSTVNVILSRQSCGQLEQGCGR